MAPLSPGTKEWIGQQAGSAPVHERLWAEALTHGSAGSAVDYQRLEFLGDRVLGLVIADWLYGSDNAAEGALSQRLNVLVSREICARIARDSGLPPHIRLGKQAMADGGLNSDNILGDVVEAVIGACYLDHGFDAAKALVHKWWAGVVSGNAGLTKHPKSALQEWAAGNQRRMPEYELIGRSGPDHALRFTVRVSIRNVGDATGTGESKQQAETDAAAAFMDQYG
ncbi:ribonuclease III [Croceicoccus sp. F390]|uniref:Ribonuclease 3 n=1 Tax=Croceicoccus esteveae TaxID=3075597 RepID=A0ABU2ZF95_9SPHN|nr:ribonuclease III [Croceicoccus sp. F390]MDT0575276.1 ribonuclease III [Croceicoccus sp. F390]